MEAPVTPKELEEFSISVEEHRAFCAAAAGDYRQLIRPYMRPVAVHNLDGTVMGFAIGLFGSISSGLGARRVRGPQWISNDIFQDLTETPNKIGKIIEYVGNNNCLPLNISVTIPGG